MIDLNSTLFIQILNFIVLMLFLKHFAWGPILKVMKDRADKIENNIKSADRDRADAAEMKKEYETKLADARNRAQEIVDAASQRADQESRSKKDATLQECEQMKEQARAQIQVDFDEAALKMKGQVVTLSLLAAQKLLGHKMDADADAQFVSQFIDSLDKEKLGDLSC